jgi:hypothetical protein
MIMIDIMNGPGRAPWPWHWASRSAGARAQAWQCMRSWDPVPGCNCAMPWAFGIDLEFEFEFKVVVVLIFHHDSHNDTSKNRKARPDCSHNATTATANGCKSTCCAQAWVQYPMSVPGPNHCSKTVVLN